MTTYRQFWTCDQGRLYLRHYDFDGSVRATTGPFESEGAGIAWMERWYGTPKREPEPLHRQLHVRFDPPPRASTVAPVPRGRAGGFTGSQCSTCGSFAMVRSGTCETCQECGSTSGCS